MCQNKLELVVLKKNNANQLIKYNINKDMHKRWLTETGQSYNILKKLTTSESICMEFIHLGSIIMSMQLITASSYLKFQRAVVPLSKNSPAARCIHVKDRLLCLVAKITIFLIQCLNKL